MGRAAGLVALAALAACPGGGGGSVDGGPVVDARTDGAACDPDRPPAVAPDIFFAPADLETQLENRIDAARESIDIGIYGFTLTRLADKLEAAERRGVQVRVIFDRTMMQANQTVYDRLDPGGGVEKKWSSTRFPFSHAKYALIDRELAILMSANFSISGMDQQRNVGIFDRDPENVADLAEIFESDWVDRPTELDCTRLMVSPADARTRLLNLISSAEQTVDIEVYYIADIGVRTAIIGAKNRGITVRVILSEPSEVDSNSATATALEQAGIQVRILSSPVPHIKMVMVDGEAALVGSHNLSNSSLVENREVGQIVRSPSAVTLLRNRFEGDWGLARDWQ